MDIERVEQVRAVERLGHRRGLALMPRAGLAAADFVAARLPAGAQVLALAGPGNNGGDALVAATLLQARGYRVAVVMPAGPARLPDDARRAWQDWCAAGGQASADLPAHAPALVIDGLFGIGLARPLDGAWQGLIDQVNAWRVPVLALDVPSGLSAASGQPLGDPPGRPVRATWTLSFIGVPAALRAPGAAAWCGEQYLSLLGLTPAFLAEAVGPCGQATATAARRSGP
ncbi:YjeF family N-terminal domain protein [Bordetella bronchiseptica MBORD635]|uniref:NAD(P)H-hydrate epimerase n=1 Tax=Bordetella bronchiseptica TaxID=518 RepID=UPI000461FAD3|nr:NAD(P)H-hydrate epimerase [Bordetella bronchiseptica]KDC74157.1 YjeF family N-terminal domain protein [Bordetella bronchiseptica MBORD635]